jgi:hypothetical protein
LKVFVPAGVREIAEKALWFQKPICDYLRGLGIEFGFQIQGSVKGLQELNIPFPFGVHLPNNLATECRDGDKKEAHFRELEMVSSLKPQPLYAVLHGIRVSHSRLGYDEPASEGEKNYLSDIGAETYFKAAEELISFIKYLQEMGIPVALETVAFTNFSRISGSFIAETYLDLRIGSFSADMLRISGRTNCQLLVDLEHLAFAVNFAARRYNYSHLPKVIPDSLSEKEELLLKEFGIFLRPGWVPVMTRVGDFEGEVRKIGAKIYHVGGCFEGKRIEVVADRIASHAPISREDECFRKELRSILKGNPEILVLEVSGLNEIPSFTPRLPNPDAQIGSLENLCQILAEEI